MNARARSERAMWDRHALEWRDPAQTASQWREASLVDPILLKSRASPGWWELLESLGLTLFVTREYEHLAMAMSVRGGRPRISYFPVPHPSGLIIDRDKSKLFLASTRNPNQIYTMLPAGSAFAPVSSAYYPGSLYIHDLALFGDVPHASAVGHNAVVRLGAEGAFENVWWPECIESDGVPDFSKNYIQLNSIAAGKGLRDSFYSASASSMGRARPGHLNFRVDGRGVIFSGRTREPICTGLTRPHSARLSDGAIWVANSGYGEIGFVRDRRLEVVRRLPGWTRGLCLVGDIVFAGTSRVIPRYANYAPGLDVSRSRCGIHAVSRKTGAHLGSIEWPMGNQVFAIDWISSTVASGFPFQAPFRKTKQEIALFYSYPKSGG